VLSSEDPKHSFLAMLAKLREATITFIMSVHPHEMTGWIFMKFEI
jgi:hypothetical protein